MSSNSDAPLMVATSMENEPYTATENDTNDAVFPVVQGISSPFVVPHHNEPSVPPFTLSPNHSSRTSGSIGPGILDAEPSRSVHIPHIPAIPGFLPVPPEATEFNPGNRRGTQMGKERTASTTRGVRFDLGPYSQRRPSRPPENSVPNTSPWNPGQWNHSPWNPSPWRQNSFQSNFHPSFRTPSTPPPVVPGIPVLSAPAKEPPNPYIPGPYAFPHGTLGEGTPFVSSQRGYDYQVPPAPMPGVQPLDPQTAENFSGYGRPVFYPGTSPMVPHIPGLNPDSGASNESQVWKSYVTEATQHDKDTITNWNQNIDVILVFAALFSAILTAFLIEFYQGLQPDPAGTAANLLANITLTLQVFIHNQTQLSPLKNTFPVDSQFTPPIGVLWVNGLWFASLTFSLGAALGAMVVKQWLQHYGLKVATGTDYDFAQQRQFRYNALVSWRVPGIISALPLLLHLSVGLFLVGLVIQLWQVNLKIALLCLVLLSALGVCYGVSLILPLLYPTCPYKSSALIRLQESIYYLHINMWKLVCTLSITANGMLKELDWPHFLIPIDAIYKKYTHAYANSPLDMENQQLAKIRPQLDIDGVIWLLKTSQNQKNVHLALEFIKELDFEPGLVEQLLQNDVLDLLVQKCQAPLPAPDNEFWRKLKKVPGQWVTNRLLPAVPYMQSLIYTWHHPQYFSYSSPPAVSYMEMQSSYAPLFSDWLKLYRSIRKDYEGDLLAIQRTGWNIDIFALLICTEVYYYCRHPRSSVPLCQLSHLGEDNLLFDLSGFMEHIHKYNLQLQNETICLILDAMACALIDMHSTSDSVIPRSDILQTLLCLLELYETSDGTVLQRLIYCMQLFAIENPDDRKRTVVDHYGKFSKPLSQQDANILICELLYKIVLIYCPRLGSKIDPVMTRTINQLYLSFLQYDKPISSYHDVFINLPTSYADHFLSNLSVLDSRWREFYSVEWLIDLLCKWYESTHSSLCTKVESFTRLGSLLFFDWSDKDLSQVSAKILPFFSGHLKDSDEVASNALCDRLCYMLRKCLLAEKSNQRLLEKFSELQTIDAVTAFLTSDKKNTDCSLNWMKLVDEWREQFITKGQEFTPTEQHIYTALVSTLCITFPGETIGLEKGRESVEIKRAVDEVDQFAIGRYYRPVLHPNIAKILQVKLKINPRLQPGPGKSIFDHISFDLLTTPSSLDIMASRIRHADEVATFPSVSTLRLVSALLPWVVVVEAQDSSIGVTYADIVERIVKFFRRLVPKDEYWVTPPSQRNKISAAYYHRQSLADASDSNSETAPGLRRIDWLDEKTVYSGIFENDELVKVVQGDANPCTFELRWMSRNSLPMIEPTEASTTPSSILLSHITESPDTLSVNLPAPTPTPVE